MEIAIPMPDLIGRLQKRLLANTAELVEEWSSLVSTLSKWEDDYLLDNPTLEALAAHKQSVERCLFFGRLLACSTEKPDFPDRRIAEMVAATQVTLQDKLRMWHGSRMSKEESDRILTAWFPQ
jgi:hypothetical protein